MNTQQILDFSLRLAGLSEVPADTAVYVPGENVRRVLVGIDLGEADLLAARSWGYDLVLTHHPAGGTASLGIAQVFQRHVDYLVQVGVPLPVAQTAVADKVFDEEITAHARNYLRLVALARRVGVAFMNIHTPLDEIGRQRLARAVGELPPQATVADLADHLRRRFGEFRHAQTPIACWVGQWNNRVGRAFVSHGAGTNGGYAVAQAFFDHGIDTVLYIHAQPGDVRRLRAEYVGRGKNLVVTGHIASDSVGINPFVRALRDQGLEVDVSDVVPE